MTIGQRIKQLREEKGIGLTELAEIVDVSKQSLYKYETGIVTNIPSDKIEAIADALSTTPAYLMGWDNKTTSRYDPATIDRALKMYTEYQKLIPEIQTAVDGLLQSHPPKP